LYASAVTVSDLVWQPKPVAGLLPAAVKKAVRVFPPDFTELTVYMQRIKNRKDFLSAARAVTIRTRGVVMQARNRGDDRPARIGFTVTKRIGNAVVRNRTRRRLKEAVRLALPQKVKPGCDYVFIGRAMTAGRPFERLQSDLIFAVDKFNKDISH
jgi:ribonuclease P protein component